MIIEVARLGQRLVRDDRVTTHAALVSRAFGASRIYMSEANSEITETVQGVNQTWGGSFRVTLNNNLKSVIRRKKAANYTIIHLTMYGYSLDDYLNLGIKPDKILIVIGAGKIPRDIYELADYNVSVGSQPHSEIAALAVFMDRIQKGRQLNRQFTGAARRIIPSLTGKCVVDSNGGKNVPN